MSTRVLAFSCHPDDIEFMMSGTLFRLRAAGCELHYLNIANGSCGTTQFTAEQIVRIRREEGKRAAEYLGAAYHESFVNDLEVYYTDELVRKATAVIREVAPSIILLQSPEDYMEDHMNAVRIGVTAAFCRGMPNFRSIPDRVPTAQDVMLYHALPYGLVDGMRRAILPELYVDVSDVIDDKERMLACHESQKRWLDESQGLGSYVKTMRSMTAEVGRMSGAFAFAEGWRRHAHLGFSAKDGDPLSELLGARLVKSVV